MIPRAGWAWVGVVTSAALVFDPDSVAAATKLVWLLLVGAAGLALVTPEAWWRARACPLPLGMWAWLLFAAYTVLSLAWSEHPSPARPMLWLAGAVAVWPIVVLDDDLRRQGARWLCMAVVLGSSMIALAQYASGARGLAVHGGHGNPNWLGLVLAVGLPVVLEQHAELWQSSPRARWLTLSTVVSALGALVLAESFVAWVALAIAGLIFVRGWKRVAVLGAAASVALLAAPQIARSFDGRAWIWTTSLRLAVHRLGFGHGHGSFPFVFLDAQGARLAALEPDLATLAFVNATSAHGDWIQLLCEGGAVAVLLLGLALVSAALSTRLTFVGAAAGLTALVVCALGDAPLEQPAIVVMTIALLAATPRVRPRPLADKGALAATLALAALCLPRAGADWIASRWLSEAARGPLDERITWTERAADLAPWSGEALLAMGLGLSEAGEHGRATEALERSRELLANVSTDVALGNAELASGRAARAASSYRRALARHPGMFRARANLAEALRAAGKLDEADRELALARDLLPHDPKLLAIAERIRVSRIEHATK